jgi:erythromycin esterase-like protein
MWKKHIDSDLIESFMDRMFETYRYSFHDMENALKDFAYNSKICSDEICEDCSQIAAFDKQMEKLNEMRIKTIQEKDAALEQRRITILDRDRRINERDKAIKDSQRNRDLYTSMVERYNKLKENSVIFSMEEREW